VLGISGSDPSFRSDDGSADADVLAALEAFATGRGSERDALIALAASRLLIPIVAVRADAVPGPMLADTPVTGTARPGRHATGAASRGEKASEMALPTLIGRDGRRAVPAFTCLDSLRRWEAGARPVPVAARQVWLGATGDSRAVVIDVAGPVPFVVEGARLAALAGGDCAPLAWADPDVHEIVAAVLAGHSEVASFTLGPAGTGRDLAINVTMVDQRASRAIGDVAEVVAADVMARLGRRLRRGVEIWLG
jgi:hypothetical protein